MFKYTNQRLIYNYGLSLFEKYKVTNLVYSATDPMNFDFGHTIPWTYELMSKEEKLILEEDNWDNLKNMISKKRRFVNSAQTLKIQETFAFTIEPRLKSIKNEDLPTASFHLIIAFKNGLKSVNDNFTELFEVFNMKYLI